MLVDPARGIATLRETWAPPPGGSCSLSGSAGRAGPRSRVEIARKLAEAIWHMLTDQVPSARQGPRNAAGRLTALD